MEARDLPEKLPYCISWRSSALPFLSCTCACPPRAVEALKLPHVGWARAWFVSDTTGEAKHSAHGAGPVMCCGVSLAVRSQRTGAQVGQLIWSGEEVEVSLRTLCLANCCFQHLSQRVCFQKHSVAMISYNGVIQGLMHCRRVQH